MTMKTISLFGTPQEIGSQHGQLLSDQIHQNIEFYKSIFLQTFGSETRILSAAERFKQNILNYNHHFVAEIDSIARSAAVPEPLWLYAMNARTELSMLNGLHECTALVCPSKNLLAQTWDWARELEGRFTLMEVAFPDGHKILQLSEAGIIGKIGLNNQGLGVTLNYLYDQNTDLTTVPIHILLRQVLESRTLSEAIEAAQRSGNAKASNLIIAQAGEAVNIEFAGDIFETHEIEGDRYVHTNHFLHAKPANRENEESYQNSVTRLHSAYQRLKSLPICDIEQIKQVLSDQSNGKYSILARYKPDPEGLLGEYGTLATIIMDLEGQTVYVRSGNPNNQDFNLDVFEVHQLC
jgi:isopenicillin-N N-acyltransferase-like protein